MFGVDDFGRPAYLAQSLRPYKQMMVGVFERVYETGPAFRAEPHGTVRHLAGYGSLDAEPIEVVLRDVLAAMVTGVRGDGEIDAIFKFRKRSRVLGLTAGWARQALELAGQLGYSLPHRSVDLMHPEIHLRLPAD